MIPDLHLIELLLDIVLISFNFLLFFLEFVELVVLNLDVNCHEDKLVAKIPHTFNPSNPSLSVRYSSRLIAAGCQLRLLSRFEHTRYLRKDTQIAYYLTYVSGLSSFSKLVS
jgi:hypothetical protein